MCIWSGAQEGGKSLRVCVCPSFAFFLLLVEASSCPCPANGSLSVWLRRVSLRARSAPALTRSVAPPVLSRGGVAAMPTTSQVFLGQSLAQSRVPLRHTHPPLSSFAFPLGPQTAPSKLYSTSLGSAQLSPLAANFGPATAKRIGPHLVTMLIRSNPPPFPSLSRSLFKTFFNSPPHIHDLPVITRR